jgi:hypothetical protein
MLAEGGLRLGRLERQEEVAERVHGRDAPEARAEGGVQPLAMHADEGQDAALGGGARQDGRHGEEQQGGERVGSGDPAGGAGRRPLPAARVGDPFQGGKQPANGTMTAPAR